MSEIHFNLQLSDDLAGMAPAPLLGGGFGNATLPQGMNIPGIYMIVNRATNNRYVGISDNIEGRFKGRLSTITEMGFDAAMMRTIGVTWGQVDCLDTPAPGYQQPQPFSPLPQAGAYTTLIDGVSVNLERLLIRFCITPFGVGGTVSNNMMAALPYANPTGNPVAVRVTWGAMGNLYQAGYQDAVWGVGPGNAW